MSPGAAVWLGGLLNGGGRCAIVKVELGLSEVRLVKHFGLATLHELGRRRGIAKPMLGRRTTSCLYHWIVSTR